MKYHQITYRERVYMAFYKWKGYSCRQIAKSLGRSTSTITREFDRNSNEHGVYRAENAQEHTNARRIKTRKKPQFSREEFELVLQYLFIDWSPEQISNVLKKAGQLNISHTTIYRYIRKNRIKGGKWHKHLRQATRKRRKKYGTREYRGRVRDKLMIEDRPKSAIERSEVGHFEIDTVWGMTRKQLGDHHCIMTLVDRKSGFTYIGKLKNRTTNELNRCLLEIIKRANGKIKTITADNGTEFHAYREIEEETGVTFYFCRPYHSWERGTNENTNGLIRQYLPKGKSMRRLSQAKCDSIATRLNQRPRKRFDYETPEVIYVQ